MVFKNEWIKHRNNIIIAWICYCCFISVYSANIRCWPSWCFDLATERMAAWSPKTVGFCHWWRKITQVKLEIKATVFRWTLSGKASPYEKRLLFCFSFFSGCKNHCQYDFYQFCSYNYYLKCNYDALIYFHHTMVLLYYPVDLCDYRL